MTNVDKSRIPAYYHRYVDQVAGLDLKAALARRHELLLPLLRGLSPAKWDHAYAPGKWTIKELVLHLTDSERVFAYRALRFARHDETPLPSYDENLFADHCGANDRTPESLLEETEAVFRSTDLLFESFGNVQLERTGVASNNPVYVGGIGFIIAGHTAHHVQIMLERYL